MYDQQQAQHSGTVGTKPLKIRIKRTANGAWKVAEPSIVVPDASRRSTRETFAVPVQSATHSPSESFEEDWADRATGSTGRHRHQDSFSASERQSISSLSPSPEPIVEESCRRASHQSARQKRRIAGGSSGHPTPAARQRPKSQPRLSTTPGSHKSATLSYMPATQTPAAFLNHEVVWAKLGSHPYWPAKVSEQHAAGKSVPHNDRSDVFVVFFGSNDWAWVPAKNVARFACKDYAQKASSHSKPLQSAISKAWSALGQAMPTRSLTNGRLELPVGFGPHLPACIN